MADWEVRVEDGTVVVDLPADLELDQETGKAINEQFVGAVARDDVDSALTLLAVEDPLSTGVFDEVKTGAKAAAENGVTDWAIVVETKVKGMAFQSQLDELDTAVFEDEDEARAFLR
jgi:hypothetical protein